MNFHLKQYLFISQKIILIKNNQKNIKEFIGREIDDNFDEQNELLEEEENEDKNEKDNVFDDEIKKLIKERDKEINNIIMKYQDKMDKMKKEQNKKTIED